MRQAPEFGLSRARPFAEPRTEPELEGVGHVAAGALGRDDLDQAQVASGLRD